MTLPLLFLAWFVGSPLVGLALGYAIGCADEARRRGEQAAADQGFKSYNHRERN